MKETVKRIFLSLTFIASLIGCNKTPVNPAANDLQFTSLATVWDEAMPMGNADVGVLVWQKENRLRFSLDRIDLWDLRPTDSLTASESYTFDWIIKQVEKGDTKAIRAKYEEPYNLPGPSKIPGAALEIDIKDWGKVTNTRLFLKNALCSAEWENGTSMKSFVQADRPIGWFIFKNVPDSFNIELIPPAYNTKAAGKGMGLSDNDLNQLGYEQGTIKQNGNIISYHQKGYGDFFYDVAVGWEQKGKEIVGVWSISSSINGGDAVKEVAEALKRDIGHDYKRHMDYWNEYWSKSVVCVPDSTIQRQYDREIYKFGSVARENSYPISLQAVWTADNGHLPPWKGDYHHDLNTELSYWPAYSGNRLNEGLGFLNTLWNQKESYRKFTKTFFGTDGINVPGICTLDGQAMGGWAQYSFSQTTGAWVSQHFYLHWKYSADKEFLKERAYPFIKDVATYLEQQSTVREDGTRTFELSTSPEVNGNSLRAWFKEITNYDLALMRFTFVAAAEMADSLDLSSEAQHWTRLASQLPDYACDEEGGLAIAPSTPMKFSHRHFSHAIAIHPLGLIDITNGDKDRKTIEATLAVLHKYGTDWWTGYSFSWLANIEARAGHGEQAAEALKIFADCFCLKNSFHANGDQTKSGKSRFTYRPFTLEGNFAFAAAVQEMLIQSHTGTINIFPAIPDHWKDVKFENLRAVGAFLVSAEMKEREVVSLKIFSEKGEVLKIRSPKTGEIITRNTSPGEIIRII